MNVLNPLAWIGLLSITAIIVMYLLKQKYTEITVPSLFLWKRALTMSQAQRPWQKLQRNMAMFLQLLLALLLVFALANPYIAGREEVMDYILVLDTSMSMQATDVLPSRFEKAKETMREMVNNAKPGSHVSIVVAGPEPYIAVNFSSDKAGIRERIKSIAVSYAGLDEESAASLIKMLKEQRDAKVYVFSDQNDLLTNIEKESIVIGSSVNKMQ